MTAPERDAGPDTGLDAVPPDGSGRRGWTLAARFALAGGVVLLLATVVVGWWVSERIRENVVRNTANATTLYMDSIIAPIAQELASAATLSPEARARLDALFEGTPLGERVISYKIWKEGGLIAAASDHALVGRRLQVTRNLRLAWQGEVRAAFENLSADENRPEQRLGLPLLEIYSPIREEFSGRIIAVAEFYEVNTQLARDLAAARLYSWIAVAGLMAALGSILFVIVLRGSATIERQRAALAARVRELAEMSDANRALRLRVQHAAGRAAAMNEAALRRIGDDLREGPARRLAEAAARLDALRGEVAAAPAREALGAVARATEDAMQDIRDIARGLSPPDVETRSPGAIVEAVIDAHAARTGDAVARELAADGAGPELPPAARICLYRFVQEGLENAHLHAGGRGVRVTLRLDADGLEAIVADRGPGLAALPEAAGARRAAGGAGGGGNGRGFGLSGLRDRIESLGGRLEIAGREGGGLELRMTLGPGGE